MSYPATDRLLKKTNTNRFALVIAIAKRAYRIDEFKENVLPITGSAPGETSINIAINEFADNYLIVVDDKTK